MSERLYNIVLTGRIHPGFTHEDVIQGLARITKRPPATIERLLLQHEPAVARNVSRGDVRVYIAKIGKSGAIAEARAMHGEDGPPLPLLNETVPAPAPAYDGGHVLEMAPIEPPAPTPAQEERERASARLRAAIERRAAALEGSLDDDDHDDDEPALRPARAAEQAADLSWPEYFAGLFRPGHRISRLGFLYRTLIFTLALLPLHLVALFMRDGHEQPLTEAAAANAMIGASTGVSAGALLGALSLTLLLTAVILFVLFIPTIQRLHDQSRSGWWALTLLVPFLNFALLYFLLGVAGDDGPNAYGPPPPNPPLLENPAVIAVAVVLIIAPNLI